MSSVFIGIHSLILVGFIEPCTGPFSFFNPKYYHMVESKVRYPVNVMAILISNKSSMPPEEMVPKGRIYSNLNTYFSELKSCRTKKNWKCFPYQLPEIVLRKC